MALLKGNADEYQGEVYGFSLVYSGNFLAQAEVNRYNQTRVTMGINPFDFRWKLEKGEEFQTPEVVMVYSDSGLNKMSQVFHNIYRKRLARENTVTWKDRYSLITGRQHILILIQKNTETGQRSQ